MLKIIKEFWAKQDSLERKLFWSIIVVVTGVATFSAIFTIIEGINSAASLCSVGCSVVCIIIAAIAVRTGLYNQCYLVMCCILSCFLMPLLFLFCGGITSGMPLYCITSISLIAFAQGRLKLPAFILSLCIQSATIAATWANPNLLVTQLDHDAAYLDILVTHLLTGFTLFAIGTFSLWAYAKERDKTTKLVSQLDYLSMHDSLTGLYNRRHLLNYLENSIWARRNDFYLAMLDIDDFKKINYTYGQDFGDEVIRAVGHLLQKNEDEMSGECVARYGCEKYMYVINAGSEVEAYAKVESFRKAIRNLTFENHPQVSLTVSGGFVPCFSRGFADVKQMLIKVDSLRVAAKQQGKNQIRNMVE